MIETPADGRSKVSWVTTVVVVWCRWVELLLVTLGKVKDREGLLLLFADEDPLRGNVDAAEGVPGTVEDTVELVAIFDEELEVDEEDRVKEFRGESLTVV